LESKTKKKLFLIAVKVLVSAVLLTVVFRKAGLRDVFSHLGAMDLRYFGLSCLLYILVVPIAAMRWGLLLDKKYPAMKLVSLYFIGSFFNNILPGAVGGDTVKIYYLYKETGKGGNSAGSVFLDRYVGLFTLLFIGLVSSVFAFRELATVRMQWVVPSLFSAYVAGSLIVFGFRIGKRISVLADFYDYFHKYLKNRKTLFKAFLLSLAVQTLSIGTIQLIALGLGQKLPFAALFIFVPIIITVTTIPISISGFGVREGAFSLLFGLIGIPPQMSTSISFLWFLSVAVTSLIGLVEYLRLKNGP
jgi:uncharacterized membrane protein YbhN (UPF0104 family)